jgi:hypothetical protein
MWISGEVMIAQAPLTRAEAVCATSAIVGNHDIAVETAFRRRHAEFPAICRRRRGNRFALGWDAAMPFQSCAIPRSYSRVSVSGRAPPRPSGTR